MATKKPQRIDNLTFIGQWNRINQQPKLLRAKIMKRCKCTYSNFYKWTNGTLTPPPLQQDIISKILNTPSSTLFPKHKEESK